MCLCPCCHGSTSLDAAYCSDCGTPLHRARTLDPVQLSAVTGTTVRLIGELEQLPALGPTVRLVEPQIRPATLRHVHQVRIQRIHPWRDVGVPLVAWVFVISIVMGVAEALAVVGISPRGLATIGVPVAGALLSEAAWMHGRWRSGLLGMLAWDALIWLLAARLLLG